MRIQHNCYRLHLPRLKMRTIDDDGYKCTNYGVHVQVLSREIDGIMISMSIGWIMDSNEDMIPS